MKNLTKVEILITEVVCKNQDLSSTTNYSRKHLRKTQWFFSLLLMFVLISVQSLSATIFIEENGLVLMEVESIPLVAPWQSKTDIAGYSGTAYYLGTANFFGVGGNHVLNYKISIKTAGLYQLNIRSRIAEGTSSTDHNDHFVRMLSGDTKVLAPAPNDNHATGTWYKFYQNKLNIWTWQTSNKDNDPRSLSWNLTPGVYWIQISMRSKGCAIDKIALWNKAKHALANAATGNSTVAQNNALNALALSQRKFWDRYVVNDPGISSNLDFAVATQKNFKISQISNGNYEAENPFSDPFSIKIINMNGQVIKEEKGINQAVYNFSITANTSVIAIFMVSNGLRTYSQKIVIQ